jgi:hypothetical protein
MWYISFGDLTPKVLCPSCTFHNSRELRDDELVKWQQQLRVYLIPQTNSSSPKYLMMYCHWNPDRVHDESEPRVDISSASSAENAFDELSSFQRVDLIRGVMPKSWESSSVWYCTGYGDGPIPDWNPVCMCCDSRKA